MRNEGTAMKQSGLMLLVITCYKHTDLSKVHVIVIISNINTGIVKDRISYALHIVLRDNYYANEAQSGNQ